MREKHRHSRVALAEFFLVVLCCIALSIWPQLSWVPLIIAVLPWIVRIIRSGISFRTTLFDPLIIAFLVTSFIGLWVAYDAEIAFQRFYLIIGATLLFYSLAHQPHQNIWYITTGLGIFGILTTTLFLLIQDWTAFPADIGVVNQVGQLWTEIRPSVYLEEVLDIQLIHANIVGGINAILLPLCSVTAIYHWQKGKKKLAVFSFIILSLLTLGLVITSSRAAWFAVLVGFGVLAVLNIAKLRKLYNSTRYLLLGLPILIVILGVIAPIILANITTESTNPLTEITSFTSRLRIARDTFHLIADYPFTGGGLGSFPGLYSQYILIIPYFLFSYSHNLYLDLALELGIFGFLIWVCIITLCTATVIHIIKDPRKEGHIHRFGTAIYASLIILLLHGNFDDPIYGSAWGLGFLFLLPGFSIAISDLKTSITFDIKNHIKVGIIGVGTLLTLLIIFFRPLLATWYANIGSINMAQIELVNWPTGEWTPADNLPAYDQAESQFMRALTFQENNRTANYRLGLVSMSRHEFQQAADYLETSFYLSPNHRGIKKTLGYCYTWLGKFDEAELILEDFPEAKAEMEIYTWWWQTQGRDDLAENASYMANRLTTKLN